MQLQRQEGKVSLGTGPTKGIQQSLASAEHWPINNAHVISTTANQKQNKTCRRMSLARSNNEGFQWVDPMTGLD
jgi:hypothetical protein